MLLMKSFVRGTLVALVVLPLAAVGSPGCEAPLAPTPSPNAALLRLFVACGNWTVAGATCAAHAVYSDGGELDVTSQATWESSDITIATVRIGRVAFVALGNVSIRANYLGFTGSAQLSTAHSGHP